MNAPHIPLYSRLPFDATPLAGSAPRPTRIQRVIEYTLFAVFSSTLVIAALALFFTNSEQHQQVPNRIAAGLAADRVNILLVVSASDRSRAWAESLMLLSVRPSTGDVAVISIPNDLWVRLGHYGARRIGSAIAVGSTSGYPGRGPGLVSDTVSSILGQPVHGFVRLTPAGVRELVDRAGGIDVNVTRPAYDAASRDHFRRGHHHLSGARAVRYAFSKRMAAPASDRFAREARQREVLNAILSRHPQATALRSDLSGVTTNIHPDQLALLYDRIEGHTARAWTLAPYVDVIEVATIADKGEAVRPRPADFAQLQRLAANALSPAIHIP